MEEAFKNYDWPSVTNLWIPFASASVHLLYHHYGVKFMTPLYLSVSTEKNKDLREPKAKKNADNFVRATYLVCSSIVCLYYLN